MRRRTRRTAMAASVHVLLLAALAFASATAAQDRAAQDRAPQPAQAGTRPDPHPTAPVQPPRLDKQKLLDRLRTLGASESTLTTLTKDLENQSDSKASDRALRTISPEYAAAVAKAEAGDPGAAVALTQLIASKTDALVVAHAR